MVGRLFGSHDQFLEYVCIGAQIVSSLASRHHPSILLRAHMSMCLRNLELVKFGHSTRDDIHDKSEENGRIDLVFKAKNDAHRATMIYLLFQKW